MNLFDMISRIVLGVMLVLVAFMAPFWVTVALALVCMVGVSFFIEGVLVVMIIEYIARDFIGFGVIGWVCLLWLLICESRRQQFRMSSL